jgi:SAM-dependent methyltransferase
MSDTPVSTPPGPPPEALGPKLARLRMAWQEAKIVMAGVELGLYDRLARAPASAAELARDLTATLRGIEILADALVATGYLRKTEGRYANVPEIDRLLVRGRADGVAHALAHANETLRNWAQLEKTILHGPQRAERDKPTLSDPVANRNFILAMAEGSRERVGPVLDRLPLASARRLVDLGGGPGQYACEAVRRHAGLEAVVVDLPLTVAVAKEQIAAQGLERRVGTYVCDFYGARELDLGGPADAVLISQVLHAEGPDENRALLRRLAPHVLPGGWVAVAENLVAADRTAPVGAAMFAVNMLAGTARGRTYTAEEISGWLAEAGLQPEPAIDAAERAAIILARKPAG